MIKKIHYCWFGSSSKPKKFKKYLKSWKKYFPDFEIVEWNETNFDINCCEFVKQAYDKKKWAFVADYARALALYNEGGLYLDTDMYIKKDMSELLKEETFLGIEDSGYPAAGIWWEKSPKNYLPKKLLNFYNTRKGFDINSLYSFSIPKIINTQLQELGFNINKENKIIKLDKNIVLYPREYFYPLSYNYKNNIFTDNTYAVHYFDATWISKRERTEIRLIRMFGENITRYIMSFNNKLRRLANIIWKIMKHTIFWPLIVVHRKKYKLELVKKLTNNVEDQLKNIESNKGIIFSNPNWHGVTNSIKELSDNILYTCNENEPDEYIEVLCDKLLKMKAKAIIFNGYCETYDKITKNQKLKNIKKYVFWHGGDALNSEWYDSVFFEKVFDNYKNKKLEKIFLAKESMYEAYKKLGFNVGFFTNNYIEKIKTSNKIKKYEKGQKVKIGIYVSGDRWIKNLYNQLLASRLIENSEVDFIPLNQKIEGYANIIDLPIVGSYYTIDRNEIIEKMKEKDIVLYTTFSECSPLIPLESLENNTICLSSPNHHYFKSSPKLREYLTVRENDNVIEIANSIKRILENQEEILSLYRDWKDDYNTLVDENNKKIRKELYL